MTQDPIQPIADIGRRALETVRYLAAPPIPHQPIGSYENQLRDPVLALSGLCNELLERLTPAPVEAEPEDLTNEPGSRFVSAPNPDSALSPSSRAGTRETRIFGNERDEPAGSRRENQRPQWADMPSLDEASPSERHLWPKENASTSRDEPSGGVPWGDSPAPASRPAMDGSSGHHPAAHARNAQHPVRPDGESSQEERRSEGTPPFGQDLPESGRAALPLEAPSSDVPERAENGSVPGAEKHGVSLPGSRLTGSTERLAAILRSHVAQPEPFAAGAVNQEGGESPSSWQESAELGAVEEPARTRPPASLAGIEEIMERLAEELETEFVRTYGRSGG